MLWLIAILLIQTGVEGNAALTEEQFLRRGLELEREQQYGRALDLWERAVTELEAPSLAIGREYIRLATGQQLRSRYETASAIYRWGVSAAEIAPNAEALEKELAMLEPLAEEGKFRKWKDFLEKENPELYRKLLNFWRRLDPTPATAYNERLLEHWERIAYAREHFTRREYPPYGTDERGTGWIQYGEPDRTYDGRLRLSSGRIASVIDLLDPRLGYAQKKALINATLKLHTYPRYEIWIHEEPDKSMEYNLVLIFGDRPSGGFGRLETVDDFIPTRAFSASGRHEYLSFRSGGEGKRSGMTPGMVMQWLYYEQLAPKDFYFSHVYDQMANAWEGDIRVGENMDFHKDAGPILQERTRMATMRNLQKAPEELSTHEKEFPAIPLEVHQYRLLDGRNRPVFATFLESRPQQLFVEDLAANEERMSAAGSLTVAELFGHYELLHGLQLRAGDGRVLTNERVPAELLLDSTGSEPSSSLFMTPQVPEEGEQLLYAELHNRHPESVPRVESPFPRSLRGLGKLEYRQPEPLDNTPQRLQMGDLILGYHRRGDSADEPLFPFIVANDRKIPADQNLVVHVEVYHLQESGGGPARFQLDYEILPVNRLGWTRERQKEISLTLNNEIDGDRYTEDLEIRTRRLNPGRYVLRMAATDRESGQQVRREIEFEVVEAVLSAPGN